MAVNKVFNGQSVHLVDPATGAPLAAGTGSVIDSAGGYVNPDNYAQTFTYNTDGTVATIAFTDGTNTWTQTFTYTNGNVTGISKWVRS